MNTKPVGGVSLIVSLMILTSHKIKKEFISIQMRKTILSIFIIGAILIYLILCAMNQIDSASLLHNKKDCGGVYHKVGERNIILRIDDIQAYSNNELQIKMLNELVERGFTSSLGVIPINLLEDKKISNYLSEHKCNFEIALHGYDNTDYEFSDLTYSEAKEKLEKGLKILNKIEPDIITFIPPNNDLSEESEKAVWDKDIEIISAGFWNSEYGFSVSTYDWENKKLSSYEKVIEECKKDLDNNETCIIMIHPQDYITNGELDLQKYKHYIEFLDGIDELNANVITFRDLYYKNKGIIRLN